MKIKTFQHDDSNKSYTLRRLGSINYVVESEEMTTTGFWKWKRTSKNVFGISRCLNSYRRGTPSYNDFCVVPLSFALETLEDLGFNVDSVVTSLRKRFPNEGI